MHQTLLGTPQPAGRPETPHLARRPPCGGNPYGRRSLTWEFTVGGRSSTVTVGRRRVSSGALAGPRDGPGLIGRQAPRGRALPQAGSSPDGWDGLGREHSGPRIRQVGSPPEPRGSRMTA